MQAQRFLPGLFCFDLIENVAELVGVGRLGVFFEEDIHLALGVDEVALRLPGPGGKEVNDGGAVMFARMHIVRGGNDRGEIAILKFGVGQGELQLIVEGGNGGGLAEGVFCVRILLEDQVGAAQVEIGSGEMVIECDGLEELVFCWIVLAEIEVGGAEGVMGRDKFRINRQSFLQVVDGSAGIVRHEQAIALVVLPFRFAGGLEIEDGDGTALGLQAGAMGIAAADEEHIEVHVRGLDFVEGVHACRDAEHLGSGGTGEKEERDECLPGKEENHGFAPEATIQQVGNPGTTYSAGPAGGDWPGGATSSELVWSGGGGRWPTLFREDARKKSRRLSATRLSAGFFFICWSALAGHIGEAPFAGFPFALGTLRVTASEFADGEIFWNFLDEMPRGPVEEPYQLVALLGHALLGMLFYRTM